MHTDKNTEEGAEEPDSVMYTWKRVRPPTEYIPVSNRISMIRAEFQSISFRSNNNNVPPPLPPSFPPQGIEEPRPITLERKNSKRNIERKNSNRTLERKNSNRTLERKNSKDSPEVRRITRVRTASSGTRLNYLRSSGSLMSSIRSEGEISVKLHYQKWSPLIPTNNILICFNAFGNWNDNRNTFAIAKYFVPLGYLVYSFEYRSDEEPLDLPAGHISSWKQLRYDVNKFLFYVLNPRAHVFLYARNAGCLVVLDYLLQQHHLQDLLKGVILSKPALSFLEHQNKGGVHKRLSSFFKVVSWKRGDDNSSKFVSEFTKTSKFVFKNVTKLTVPLLMMLHDGVEDEYFDTTVNYKLFQQLICPKDLIVYPATVREETPMGTKKILSDMEAWLKKHESKNLTEAESDGTYWSLLPQELKIYIFSFLNKTTIATAARVNKGWRSLTCVCLEEIDLSSETQRNLRQLLRYVASFPFLKILNLEGWGSITDTDVEYITERCQALQRLNLGGCWQITDASLVLLGDNCYNLRSLNLRSCPKITNDGLIALSQKCTLLESLNLSKCTQITSEGMTQLSQNCPHIRELDLSYFKLGHIQEGLEKFTQLQVLYLEGRQLRTSDDSDNDDVNGHLETLFEHLTNLRTLSLQGSAKVSAKVRENIAKFCTKLKTLNLSNT